MPCHAMYKSVWIFDNNDDFIYITYFRLVSTLGVISVTFITTDCWFRHENKFIFNTKPICMYMCMYVNLYIVMTDDVSICLNK